MSNTFQFAERLGFESKFDTDNLLSSPQVIIIPNKKRIIEEIKKAIHDRKRYFKPLKEIYTNTAYKKSLYPLDFEDLKGINYNKIQIIGNKLYKDDSENNSLQINLKKPKAKLLKLEPLKEEASYSISFEYKDFPEYKLLLIINDTKTYEVLRKAWFLKTESNRIHYRWLEEFSNNKENADVLDWLYLNAPKNIMSFISPEQMLKDLTTLLSHGVDTFGTNEETAIIRLLEVLYKEVQFFENDKKQNGEKSKNPNDVFLECLISKDYSNSFAEFKNRDGREVSYNLLHSLSYRLDGDNYKAFLQFIWDIWKKSSYAILDPKSNPYINLSDSKNTDTVGPILLDYRSNKSMGFHTDNANIERHKNSEIMVDITIKTGIFDHIEVNLPRVDGGSATLSTERTVEHNYIYHLFAPIAILKADNPTFIFEDEDQKEDKFTLFPAFILLEREKKAFWENLVIGAEYSIDLLTFASGYGNILKVGRLAKILKAGHSLRRKSIATTKLKKGVKAFAGVVEITSGTGNALIKLLDMKDTNLGRAISKYLFYLEMLSLSGELTGILETAIRSSAKDLISQRLKLFNSLKKQNFDREVIEKILKETTKNAGLKTGDDLLDELVGLRAEFFDSSVRSGIKSITKAVVNKPITKQEVLALYNRYSGQYPLITKHNQAVFKTKFLDNGKVFDEVEEFSLSGKLKYLKRNFGDPPKLPDDTVDVLEKYSQFDKFATGAFDLTGRSRKFDSEIKFIYHFIKNHFHKADEFIIETSNIFKSCGSCSREFALLQELMKRYDKKLTIIVKADSRIAKTRDLKKLYPETR